MITNNLPATRQIDARVHFLALRYTWNANKSSYRRFSEADVRLNNTIEMRDGEEFSPCTKRFENDTPMIGSPWLNARDLHVRSFFFNLLRNKNQANTNEDTYVGTNKKIAFQFPYSLENSKHCQIPSRTSQTLSKLSISSGQGLIQNMNLQDHPKYHLRLVDERMRVVRKPIVVLSFFRCVHDRKKKKNTRLLRSSLHP